MRRMKRVIALTLICLMVLSNLSLSYAYTPGAYYIGMADGNENIVFPYVQAPGDEVIAPFGLKMMKDGIFVGGVTRVTIYDSGAGSYIPLYSTAGLEAGTYFCVGFAPDEFYLEQEVDFHMTIEAPPSPQLTVSDDLEIGYGEERIGSGLPLVTYDGTNGDGILYFLDDDTPVTSTEELGEGSHAMYASKPGYDDLDFTLTVVIYGVLTPSDDLMIDKIEERILAGDPLVTYDGVNGDGISYYYMDHTPLLNTHNLGKGSYDLYAKKIGYENLDFTLEVLSLLPAIMFEEDDYLNVTLDSMIPFDAMASAVDPEDGPVDLYVPVDHDPLINTSSVGAFDIEYSATDSEPHTAYKDRHINVEDQDITDGFYILNEKEKIVQKVAGGSFYEELYASDLDLEYVVDAAMNSEGEIFVAIRSDSDNSVGVYPLNNLSTPIVSHDDIIALEFNSDDFLYFASYDEIFYYANSSYWTYYNPSSHIFDFDFDNNDSTLFVMVGDPGGTRVHFVEDGEVTHINSNIPQRSDHFIFADEKLCFMEEASGNAMFTILDERFEEIDSYMVPLYGSYDQTVLANTVEADFDIYYNHGLAKHYFDWEFGSAVFDPPALMFVLRDSNGDQVDGEIEILSGLKSAYLEGMTLRMIEGGNVILKATYLDQTDYVSISLIEMQKYFMRPDYNQLLPSESYLYSIFHTDEHWDTAYVNPLDPEAIVMPLAVLYYVDEAGVEHELPSKFMIDDACKMDTRSLDIGVYSGEFVLGDDLESYWFRLSTDQDHTFTLHVENKPTEVNFYSDPLYVFMDAYASAMLGVHVVDAEDDPWNPVVFSDPNGLVGEELMLNTDNPNGGMVTFRHEMIEVTDELTDYTRSYSIEAEDYTNGILVSSYAGLVHQTMEDPKTYVAFEEAEGKLTDVAIDSSANIVRMYTNEGDIQFVRSDGQTADFEENLIGLSYDFYDELFTTCLYEDPDSDNGISFELMRLDIDSETYESVLDLQYVFGEIGYELKGLYIEDIAFNGHDLYVLLLQSGFYSSEYNVFKFELDKVDDIYEWSGSYDRYRLNDDYRYEGIAFYDGEIYVTASRYNSNDSEYYNRDFLMDNSWIMPLRDKYDVQGEMVSISEFFRAASGAAGMVVEDIQLPEYIELEYGLLATNTTYILEPYVQPFTIELRADNFSKTGDYFTFDSEAGLVTATGLMPENGDVGSIDITYNGTIYSVPVYVIEMNPTVVIEGPDYVEKDAYVDVEYGMYLSPFFENYVEVSFDGTNYEPSDGLVLNTSAPGDYTVYYRVYMELSGEDDYSLFIEAERNYTVVESDKKDVTMHIDMGGILMFRDHLNERYVYAENMMYRTEGEYDFDDIAVDGNDVLYLLAGDVILVYNFEDHSFETYYEGDWMSTGFDIADGGFTALEFGPDDQLYIAYRNNVYMIELNEDDKVFNFYNKMELEDEGWISDLLVSPDNAYIYAVSNNLNEMNQSTDGSLIRAAKYSLSDGILDAYYEEVLDDDVTRFVGLSMINDMLFMDIINRDGVNNRMLYLDENLNVGSTPYEIEHPMYGVIKGSCSRYPTIILAQDLKLDIGYLQTTADSEKYIDYIILPESRMMLPVIFNETAGINNIDVDVNGLVKGLSAGSGEVTITVDGVSAVVDIEVEYHAYPQNDPVIRVSVSPDPIEVEYGPGADPENLTAEATASVSGTNANVVWTIADETVATVDNNGVVTAVSTGETTLRASVAGRSDTVDVIVFFIDEELDPLGLVEFNEPYVSGFPNQTFGPTLPVTRAELATMFSRILNLDMNASANYNDLGDHWAKDYILAATDANIFSGYTDGSFKPDQAVTRAELAAAISNYWNYFNMDVDSSPREISDVTLNFWASSYIYKLYNTELVVGSAFNPNASTLREDVVMMLNKLIGRDALVTEVDTFTDVNASHPMHDAIEAASSNAVIKIEQ